MDYEDAVNHLLDHRHFSWSDTMSLLEVLDFADTVTVQIGEQRITIRHNGDDYEIG